MVRRGEILDDSMEDEFYLRRLDAGLFVLQLICYIMVEISNSGISQVHTQIHTPTGLPSEFSLWLIIVRTSDQMSYKSRQESDGFMSTAAKWLIHFSTGLGFTELLQCYFCRFRLDTTALCTCCLKSCSTSCLFLIYHFMEKSKISGSFLNFLIIN